MNPETSIELIGEELAEKDKDCMIFLTCGIKKNKKPKTPKKRDQTCSYQRQKAGGQELELEEGGQR